jgi:hypothetical protein
MGIKMTNTKTSLRTHAVEILRQRPLEICIGAALGGAIAFGASFTHEHAKLGQVPLAFSEIGQTRRCIEQLPDFQLSDLCGKMALKYGLLTRMPPLTEYYATVNDIFMMVGESNNVAISQWGDPKRFAYELDKKIDPALRIHTQIPEYAARIGQIAAAARASIAPLTKARRDIAPAIADLRASWDADHTDVFRTLPSTSTVCNSDGKNCHEVTTYSQVYDHTSHTYTYHSGAGQRSVADSSKFLSNDANIVINEPLVLTWKTNVENEMAMRDSRKRLPGYRNPTEADYIRWTNTWATGSNYAALAPKVYSANRRLMEDSGAWRQARSTARSVTYSTFSHFDPGPKECQIAEAALADAEAIDRNTGRIEDGIDYADKLVPVLNAEIVRYVNAKLRHRGDEDHLADKIMSDATGIYRANYAEGFDVNPAKWWMVAIWSINGCASGAAAAAGVAALADGRRRGVRAPSSTIVG